MDTNDCCKGTRCGFLLCTDTVAFKASLTATIGSIVVTGDGYYSVRRKK